jgi:hypothetical protein
VTSPRCSVNSGVEVLVLVPPRCLALPRDSNPYPLTRDFTLMFSRLSQLARHLSRPLPNYTHTSAAAVSSAGRGAMTSSSTADERNSRTIHTAACLIIGDEVLGGKASFLEGSELVWGANC